MNRRDTVFALLALGVAPVASFGQQQVKVWRIGILTHNPLSSFTGSDAYRSFTKSMRALGYVEGNNLVTELRSTEENVERMPGLAGELVQLEVDVIVSQGTPATLALQKLTSTIPIVMVGVGDPVSVGLVKTLARPGRNITGFANISTDLGIKHLEMLKRIVPKLSRVAVLADPNNPVHMATLKSVQAAALRSGVGIVPALAPGAREIGSAFSAMTRENARAVVICGGIFNSYVRQVAELAVKHRLPSIAAIPEYGEGGGLMSYGASLADMYRRSAVHVDKILKGARPADLPVEQPLKFEMVINRNTAKALSLTIPPSLLVSADRVIE